MHHVTIKDRNLCETVILGCPANRRAVRRQALLYLANASRPAKRAVCERTAGGWLVRVCR